MQIDMKLQQMQISSSSHLLSFSVENSPGGPSKQSLLRVGLLRNIISCSPEFTHRAPFSAFPGFGLFANQSLPQQNLLTMEQIVTVEETQIKDKKCILLRIKGGKQFVLQCEVGTAARPPPLHHPTTADASKCVFPVRRATPSSCSGRRS